MTNRRMTDQRLSEVHQYLKTFAGCDGDLNRFSSGFADRARIQEILSDCLDALEELQKYRNGEEGAKGRYIYHYCGVLEGQNATLSGIAQLTFRVVNLADLDRLRQIAGSTDKTLSAIISLAYLGRETE